MRFLFEGTKYDKQASKILSNSGLMSEEGADSLINSIFKGENGHEPLIHAFNYCPAWLEKYLKGIARMIVAESGGNSTNAISFVSEAIPVFDYILTYVKENRDKLGGVSFDQKFNEKMKYSEVEDMVKEIQEEIERKSSEELKNKKFNGESNFVLVPINSFEEFNEKFGGRATGDGTSDKWAGGGGTAWCHANSKSVYDSWVKDGKFKFYVLANKDWKNIPFGGTPDPAQRSYESGENPNPKDDYGNSLIAILVSTKTGKLTKATLRCNHLGVTVNPDNQYSSYAELSDVAGFNVQEAVSADLGVEAVDSYIKDGTLIYSGQDISDLVDERYDVKKIIVKKEVTVLDEYVFTDFDEVESVVFEEGSLLESINNYAFDSCRRLTEINIPDGVITIGSHAFSDCDMLKRVHLPESIENLSACAFQGCEELEEINIPESIEAISYKVFYECSSLQNITLPRELRYIGDYAFGGTAVYEVDLPETLEFLGEGVFYTCSLLSRVRIPDSITELKPFTFAYCEELSDIVIPDTVESIGRKCFIGCHALSEINIPEKTEFFGDYCFSESGFEELTLNIDSFIMKCTGAFNNCPSLKRVELISNNGSSFEIPNEMFTQCGNLETVIIPEGVKSIREYAFYDCERLSNIELPVSLESIGESAFYRCVSLKEISIPRNVKEIDRKAFFNCFSLKDIYIYYNGSADGYSPSAFSTFLTSQSSTDSTVVHTNNKEIKELLSGENVKIEPINSLKVKDGKWTIPDPTSGMREELRKTTSIKLLFEGTHYDTNAAKDLSKGIGIPIEDAERIIQDAYRNKIKAFIYCPSWLNKYIKGIARMITDTIAPVREFTTEEEAVKAAQQCVDKWAKDLDFFLKYLIENREKMDTSIDNEFVNHMSIEDVAKRCENIKEEEKKKSEEELKNQEYSNDSDFELIPINSFDEFYNKFGGRATGDGRSDSYAGAGGTAWCHTNDEGVYNGYNWTNGGENKFYVLANKNWKNIPFDKESNENNPKDDYGNSLIAILVNKETGELKNATLRCNHVGVKRNADNQYRKYSDLSKIAGFNVEKAVKDDLSVDYKEVLEDTENLPTFTEAKFVPNTGALLLYYAYDDGKFDYLKKFNFLGVKWEVLIYNEKHGGAAMAKEYPASFNEEKGADFWFNNEVKVRQEEKNYTKYILLRDEEHTKVDDQLTVGPVTYYRIKILRDDLKHNHQEVCLGGWLESYDCLSQEGDCMVYGSNTLVCHSKITEDAKVYNGITVYNSRISGKSQIRSGSNVMNSVVGGYAMVDSSDVDLSSILDYAVVYNSNVVQSTIKGNVELDQTTVEGSKIGGSRFYGGRSFQDVTIDFEE